jgi:hypothetical protein
MTRFQGMAATLLAAFVLILAQPARAADVTGTWIMSVQTSAGSGSPTFTFTQKAGVITGTYKGQLGEAPVNGTIKDDDVSWQFNIEAQGVPLTITYTGKVSGKAISGKVSLGQFGEGTFTGSLQ